MTQVPDSFAQKRSDYERNQLRRVIASRLDLEAMQDVLQGKLAVVFEANRASDIRA